RRVLVLITSGTGPSYAAPTPVPGLEAERSCNETHGRRTPDGLHRPAALRAFAASRQAATPAVPAAGCRPARPCPRRLHARGRRYALSDDLSRRLPTVTPAASTRAWGRGRRRFLCVHHRIQLGAAARARG